MSGPNHRGPGAGALHTSPRSGGGRTRRFAGRWVLPVFAAVVVVLAGTDFRSGSPDAAALVSVDLAKPGAAAVDTVSFADDVLPIFRNRCAQCHGGVGEDGETRTEVSLNLLEYERVMMGSEFGPVVEAGSAENSFLLEMIVEGDMPEQGDPVPEDEIQIIRAWIEAGAPNN